MRIMLLKKILLLSMVVLLTACDSQAIEGNGRLAKQSRSLAEFNQLDVSGKFNVMVNVGQSQQVEVSADENILPNVVTQVKDHTLFVQVRQGVQLKPQQAITVQINVPTLVGLRLAGKEKATVAGVNSARFEAVLSGKNVLKLLGHVTNLTVYSSGKSNMDASELQAETVTIKMKGSGESIVNASHLVDAVISGSGLVKYIGEPKIKKLVSGSGSIQATDKEAFQASVLSTKYPSSKPAA